MHANPIAFGKISLFHIFSNRKGVKEVTRLAVVS